MFVAFLICMMVTPMGLGPVYSYQPDNLYMNDNELEQIILFYDSITENPPKWIQRLTDTLTPGMEHNLVRRIDKSTLEEFFTQMLVFWAFPEILGNSKVILIAAYNRLDSFVEQNKPEAVARFLI